MCSLKPLAFCTHHNFKNIQKRPINSSRGKMPGKIIILIPKVFLRPLNSFEIIFRQKKHQLHCSGNPRGGSSRQVLVHSLLSVEIFCLWSMPMYFTFSFQNNHRMRRKFVVCSLEVGIEASALRIISFRHPCGPAGLKCRSQVTGQVTGYRPQVRSQVTHKNNRTLDKTVLD